MFGHFGCHKQAFRHRQCKSTMQFRTVPSVFTVQYLKKLAFGTKVETIASDPCVTITSAGNNSNLVGAIESKEFNAGEGGAEEEDGAGEEEGGAEEVDGAGKELRRKTVRGKEEEGVGEGEKGVEGEGGAEEYDSAGKGEEEDAAGEGEGGAEDESGHQHYYDSDDAEHFGPQRRVDRKVMRELKRHKGRRSRKAGAEGKE